MCSWARVISASRLRTAKCSCDEPPYVEAFAVLREFNGDGAFELAQWMNRLAEAMEAQGRADAAVALLREEWARRLRRLRPLVGGGALKRAVPQPR